MTGHNEILRKIKGIIKNEPTLSSKIYIGAEEKIVSSPIAIVKYLPLTKRWVNHQQYRYEGNLRFDIYDKSHEKVYEVGDIITDFFNNKVLNEIRFEIKGYSLDTKKIDNSSLYTTMLNFKTTAYECIDL